MLPGDIMNKLQGAFRSKLDADKKKNFAEVDKTVKAEWIAQYVLDPKSGVNTGYNKLVLRNTEEKSTSWSWKTQEQISDMLKSQEHARILVSSDDLEQRDHEYSSLARAGVKQYYVHESMFTETTSKVDEAGTSSMCDLQADHSTMVTSDMRACTIGLKRKKPTKTVKVEKSEEENAAKATAKAARLEKAGVLRNAKAYTYMQIKCQRCCR